MTDPFALLASAEFAIGDLVYLRTAKEKSAGMVTALIIRPDYLIYWVRWAVCDEMRHEAIELSAKYVPLETLELKDGEKA